MIELTGGLPIYRYETFVAQAIEGKYEGFTNAEMNRAVRAALALCDAAKTAPALFAISRRIASPQDDVTNQVVVLRAIEQYADDPALRAAPMTVLHRLAYGAEESETVRTTDTVEGFSGPIPTGLSEADARFAELQGLVVDLAAMQPPSEPVAAHLMAHVFAAVIRIHYFVDGNGRVARFAVQYLSTAWGAGFFNVPKVRNDKAWKTALRHAISGDIGGLASELAKLRIPGLSGR